MAITVYKQKAIQNSWKSEIFLKKFPKKNFFFGFFFSKSWNEGEFTNLRPETESRNRGDHELWNHEMQGSPVVACLDTVITQCSPENVYSLEGSCDPE